MRVRWLSFSQPAWAILLAVFILYGIGLLCIYADEFRHRGTPVNTIKQAINLAVGLAAFAAVLRIGYPWFGRHAIAIVVVGVLGLIPLVVAKYVPMGSFIPERRGAHCWIQLPFYSLQPSELMKVAYIIGLAAYLRFRQNYRTFSGLMVPMIASLVPMALILLEPDLGTVVLLTPVLFIMLFAAGAKIRHFLAVGLVGLALVPVFWTQLHPYQRNRFLGVLLQSESLRQKIIEQPDRYAFLGTERQAREWEQGAGMQLVRSKAALGSGGVTGFGWAQGAFVEFSFLPDKHNDFIFAMVGHQWGLLGCILVLICYFIIVLSGIEIAADTTDPFARLLAVGVVAMIATQVAVNVGVTVGLLPITGITLPFVSYGGSSLLTNALGIGLLISVSRHRPFLLANRPFEYGLTVLPDAPVRPTPAYRIHP